MSDMALFCYSCCAIGNLVKCCPDAPGSVALVPVGFANGVARTIGNLHAQCEKLESRLAEIEAQEPVAVFTGAYGGRWTFAMLDNDAVPHTAMALYTRPAAPQPRSR